MKRGTTLALGALCIFMPLLYYAIKRAEPTKELRMLTEKQALIPQEVEHPIFPLMIDPVKTFDPLYQTRLVANGALLIGETGKEVKIYDLSADREIFSMKAENFEAINKDFTKIALAFGNPNDQVRKYAVFDVSSKKELWNVSCRFVYFSTNLDALAFTIPNDFTLYTSSGKKLASIVSGRGHAHPEFSADGTKFVVDPREPYAQVYDIKGQKMLEVGLSPVDADFTYFRKVGDTRIYDSSGNLAPSIVSESSLSFSPDMTKGMRVLPYPDSDTSAVYDAASGARLFNVQGFYAVFSTDSKFFATVQMVSSYGNVTRIRVYDATSGDKLFEIEKEFPAYGSYYQSDNRSFSDDVQIFMVHANDTTNFYDMATRKLLLQIPAERWTKLASNYTLLAQELSRACIYDLTFLHDPAVRSIIEDKLSNDQRNLLELLNKKPNKDPLILESTMQKALDSFPAIVRKSLIKRYHIKG